MRNLRINKKGIASIMLAFGITLTTCSGEIKGEGLKEWLTGTTNISMENKTDDLDLYYQMINNYKYVPVYGNKQFLLSAGAKVYYYLGGTTINSKSVSEDTFVTVNESNDFFAIVTLPNGNLGYVDIKALTTCDNLNSYDYIDIENDKNSAISINTYLYDSFGHVIKYLYASQTCNKVATNGMYTLITLPDKSSGFILSDALMNKYENVDNYALLRKNVSLYFDSNFDMLAYKISDDQVVYIKYINDKYAGLYDRDGRELFVKTNDLVKNFIDVDLTGQKMNCYLDYQFVRGWGTRSGKNTTPTHEGTFDIDWKANNFEFTTYPGSYAKYWIPINEYAEGIHDLVGDDEENYGNDAYMLNGSHGCIRVPVEASKFVYDNYNVGDIVLVRKK